MQAQVVRVIVLAKRVRLLNIAEFEVFARPLNVVVDHVNQDSAAENTLFLKEAIDQVQLVSNRDLLLFSKLWLLSTVSS